MLAMSQPPLQPLGPRIGRVGGNVATTDDDAAKARVIESLLGNVDQLIGIAIDWERNTAFRPQLLQMVTPGFLQTLEKQVRPSKEQYIGRRRVPLSEGCEILANHRIEQTCDDLLACN